MLTSCSQSFLNCSGTTYEFVVLLSGPLVRTSEFLFICHTMMYICCRSYIGWLLCNLWGGVLASYCRLWISWQVIAGSGYVYVCSRGGGGGRGGSSNMWWVGWGGVFLIFLVFFRVTSLCGVTSLISFWGFGVPGELCPGVPFWVAL